jgi:nitrite reductase (NO-forming)
VPFSAIGPVLLVGVVAQVLVGSLTYLLPVVLGGGPAAVRAAGTRLDRWWPARLALLNAAIVLLATGGAMAQESVSRLGWLLAALAAVDFLVRAAGEVSGRSTLDRAVVVGSGAGVAITMFAVLVAMSGTAAPVDAHDHAHGGQARVVEVRLEGMRVQPPAINVPPGTDLTLRVSNLDSQAHDLRTGSGLRTPLLRKGETALLPLGTVTGDIDAWCTIAGHCAAGMRLSIKASGEAAESSGFSTAFKPYDATLPAAPTAHMRPSGAPARAGTRYHLRRYRYRTALYRGLPQPPRATDLTFRRLRERTDGSASCRSGRGKRAGRHRVNGVCRECGPLRRRPLPAPPGKRRAARDWRRSCPRP